MTTITAQRAAAPGTPGQSHSVADAITMLRRNLLHMLRYPGLSVFIIVGPVVFLLQFVFVFGGTLGAGLPREPSRRPGLVPRVRHTGHPGDNHRGHRRRHRDNRPGMPEMKSWPFTLWRKISMRRRFPVRRPVVVRSITWLRESAERVASSMSTPGFAALSVADRRVL